MPTPILRLLETGIAFTGMSTDNAIGGLSINLRAVHVFANIEVKGRGVASGRGCLPLSPNWCRRSWLAAHHATIVDAVSFGRWDTAYGHHIGSATPPDDARRLLDLALADAVLKALRADYFTGIRDNVFGYPTNQAIERRLKLQLRNSRQTLRLDKTAKGGPSGDDTRALETTTLPMSRSENGEQGLPRLNKIVGPYDVGTGAIDESSWLHDYVCLDAVAYVQ